MIYAVEYFLVKAFNIFFRYIYIYIQTNLIVYCERILLDIVTDLEFRPVNTKGTTFGFDQKWY